MTPPYNALQFIVIFCADNRTRLYYSVAAVETGGKQQSTGLVRDLSRMVSPSIS